MRKRIFCALWMAFFAWVAAFPLWWTTKQGLAIETVVPPLVAGAIVGASLQPLAIGRRSNGFYAALMGALSATLAMPLVLLGIILLADPMVLFSPGKFLDAVGFSLFFSLFAMLDVGMSTVALGAVAGLMLQFVWRLLALRQDAMSPGASE